ncbi:MAG: LysE family translocator [Pseudomonadota bacterium]
MSVTALALFIPACFALNLTFGPSNLLSVTVGAERGMRLAMAAGLGRLAAFAPLIALSGAGMGVVLATSAWAFTVLKLVGAAYLIWIGLKLLRAPAPEIEHRAAPAGLSALMRREFLVGIGNPKAILIFTAFFPQFVDQGAYWQSYALLGALFLVLEMGAIAVYAGIGRAVGRAAGEGLAWLTRVSGVGMIVFGALMVFARRPA